MIYRQNAPPDEARLAELNDAVKRDIRDVESRAELAMMQLNVGELDAAQKNFRMLLLHALSGTTITKADVFHKLAVIAERRGERDKAIAMAKSAIDSTRPTSTRARSSRFSRAGHCGYFAAIAAVQLLVVLRLADALQEIAPRRPSPCRCRRRAARASARAPALSPFVASALA